jgi:predicted nucleotidyltransferase
MRSKARNIEGDFLDFVQICNKHYVKYLVVGGFAVSIHGYPRYTKDLDICIKMSEENAEKLLRVIDEFGFSSLGLKKNDFLKPDLITQLGIEPLRIDILNNIDGVSFDEAWENRKMVNYEMVEVPFIGYNELLKVKLKAGRPQDIADVEKLKSRNKK